MASFSEWPNGSLALTDIEANWFTPLLIDTADGVLVFDPFTTNYDNGTGPWDVSLNATLIGASGQVSIPSTPTSLVNYETGYNFHVAAAPLGDGDYAIAYDTADASDPDAGIDIKALNVDSAGDGLSSPVTLLTDVQNVVTFQVASVGSGDYDLVYATVSDGEGIVESQIFNSQGQSVGSANPVETPYATVSGESFVLLTLSPSNNIAPANVYIRGGGTGSGTGNTHLSYKLLNDSGSPDGLLKTITPDYPTSSTSPHLVSWAATALQTPASGDPYFAVAMRYTYVQDGATTADIDVRTIDAATGAVSADVNVPVTTTTSLEILRPLAEDGFLLAYGGQSPNNVQAFDASGNEVGSDFVLPDDETHFNLAQLPNGQLVVEYPSAESGGNQLNYELLTQTVCFAAGTRILTHQGEVEVERLAVGDIVITASGGLRPIRWLGRRRLDCRRHPRPRDVMPIRVAAHAFGTNKPIRDLYLSPAHAICVSVIDEVLIPAVALVNASTIQQVETDEINYWHVELDSHDILLCENLAAESYIDMGNRSFFVESGVVHLGSGPDPEYRRHADYCRPFHHSGKIVDAVRLQLGARAQALGWTLRQDPFADLHLLADGARIEPDIQGRRVRFKVPAGANDVRLASLAACPRHAGIGDDERNLGVCIEKISVEDAFGAGSSHEIKLDDPNLDVGFHRLEHDGEYRWRWTSGEAPLPPASWANVLRDFVVTVVLAGDAVPRWVAPCEPEKAKAA